MLVHLQAPQQQPNSNQHRRQMKQRLLQLARIPLRLLLMTNQFTNQQQIKEQPMKALLLLQQQQQQLRPLVVNQQQRVLNLLPTTPLLAVAAVERGVID